MRISNYEVKRFSVERLDINLDVINDCFLKHVQEYGIGIGQQMGRRFIIVNKPSISLGQDGFVGPGNIYAYGAGDIPICFYLSLICYDKYTSVQVIEKSYEPEDARKYEDFRYLIMFQKASFLCECMSEAMKKALIECNVITREEDYYKGFVSLGFQKSIMDIL